MLSMQSPVGPLVASEVLRPPLRDETVLLAEDEDAVRNMLRLVLQRAGYQVLEARSGKQALRLCEGHVGPIHLLLADALVVPVGGRQLVEQVTLLRPDIRVLCISAYPRETLVAEGLLHPDVDFLQKPFTAGVLKEKVSALLDG
jgi:two-component system, cell cycle sensor histidine kinase and response regulator CckA